MNKKRKLDNDNTIDLPVAINLCNNWRAAFSTAFPDVPQIDVLRGFRIPIDDITALANMTEAVAVRSYLAMDNPNDPTTIKILLVPIVVDSTGQEVDKLINDAVQPPASLIYDFTQPCPVQCDVTSPLYGLVGGHHHKHKRD